MGLVPVVPGGATISCDLSLLFVSLKAGPPWQCNTTLHCAGCATLCYTVLHCATLCNTVCATLDLSWHVLFPLVPQVRFSPYMSMSERVDVLNDHRRRALTGDAKHMILHSTLAQVRMAGRRAGNASSMDRQRDQRAVATVNFFWNYNTVESVLLFSAVLVNLAGVMFESGRFDTGLYNAQKDFLTWVVVVIIVVSVMYFIVVLLSEVYTMLSATRQRKPKKADKAKGKGGALSISDGSVPSKAKIDRAREQLARRQQRQFLENADVESVSTAEPAVNPLFSLSRVALTAIGQAGADGGPAKEGAEGVGGGMNEETRKATLMALITNRAMPTPMQWAVVQVRRRPRPLPSNTRAHPYPPPPAFRSGFALPLVSLVLWALSFPLPHRYLPPSLGALSRLPVFPYRTCVYAGVVCARVRVRVRARGCGRRMAGGVHGLADPRARADQPAGHG
jgi:hypothetical protein